MGLTIETMIAIDGAAGGGDGGALRAARARRCRSKLHPVDGSLAHERRRRSLRRARRVFASHYAADLERIDSFGWRNWGDYQIGTSYTRQEGGAVVEDWANLQYDLPQRPAAGLAAHGRSAAVALRAGERAAPHGPRPREVLPVPGQAQRARLPQGRDAARSARTSTPSRSSTRASPSARCCSTTQLTGEKWARDLAKQNIDRLVYYASTRPHFVLERRAPDGVDAARRARRRRVVPQGQEQPVPGDRRRDRQAARRLLPRAQAPAGAAAGVAGAR